MTGEPLFPILLIESMNGWVWGVREFHSSPRTKFPRTDLVILGSDNLPSPMSSVTSYGLVAVFAGGLALSSVGRCPACTEGVTVQQGVSNTKCNCGNHINVIETLKTVAEVTLILEKANEHLMEDELEQASALFVSYLNHIDQLVVPPHQVRKYFQEPDTHRLTVW